MTTEKTGYGDEHEKFPAGSDSESGGEVPKKLKHYRRMNVHFSTLFG